MTTAAAYEPLVGETFTAVGAWDPHGGGPEAIAGPVLSVPITLTAVQTIDQPGPFEQFRLALAGPSDQPLEQGSYVFDPQLGPFQPLFLVPAAQDHDTRRYAASISVPRDPAESATP